MDWNDNFESDKIGFYVSDGFQKSVGFHQIRNLSHPYHVHHHHQWTARYWKARLPITFTSFYFSSLLIALEVHLLIWPLHVVYLLHFSCVRTFRLFQQKHIPTGAGLCIVPVVPQEGKILGTRIKKAPALRWYGVPRMVNPALIPTQLSVNCLRDFGNSVHYWFSLIAVEMCAPWLRWRADIWREPRVHEAPSLDARGRTGSILGWCSRGCPSPTGC